MLARRARRHAFRSAVADMKPVDARVLFMQLAEAGLPFDREDFTSIGERGLADAPDVGSSYRRLVNAVRRGLIVRAVVVPSQVWAGDDLILKRSEDDVLRDEGVTDALEKLPPS